MIAISTPVGSFDLTNSAATSLADTGNYLYIAQDNSFVSNNDLLIMNVSDPAHPVQVGVFEMPGNYPYIRLIVDGQTLYASDGTSELRAIDITDPLHPVEAGSYQGGIGVDLTVIGDYMYGYAASIMHVLDISDPSHLTQVAQYTLPDRSGSAFYLTDNNLYLIGDGLTILQPGTARTGQVTDINGRPFSGVTISAAADLLAATGLTGAYQIHPADLTSQTVAVNTYDLSASLQDYIFWPPSRTTTLTAATHGQNFIALAPAVSATLTSTMATDLTYTNLQHLNTALHFPSGAVAQTSEVTLSPRLESDQPGYAFARRAFDLIVSQDGSVQPDFVFGQPVEISLNYSNRDIRVVSDESQLALWYWTGSGWQAASATCDPAGAEDHDVSHNRLSLMICRAGRYALFGPTHQDYLPRLYR